MPNFHPFSSWADILNPQLLLCFCIWKTHQMFDFCYFSPKASFTISQVTVIVFPSLKQNLMQMTYSLVSHFLMKCKSLTPKFTTSLHNQFMKLITFTNVDYFLTCLAYSLILKMEASHSSKTSINLYQTIQHHHSEENPKSCTIAIT